MSVKQGLVSRQSHLCCISEVEPLPRVVVLVIITLSLQRSSQPRQHGIYEGFAVLFLRPKVISTIDD